MADTLYDDLDIQQNEALNFVHEQLSAFPANAREGRIIIHTSLEGVFRCKDGTGDTTLADKWARIGSKQKKRKEFVMVAGQLLYVLDELPIDDDEVQCMINGLEVDFIRSGVNITITTYTPGTVANGWVLKVYYFTY